MLYAKYCRGLFSVAIFFNSHLLDKVVDKRSGHSVFRLLFILIIENENLYLLRKQEIKGEKKI